MTSHAPCDFCSEFSGGADTAWQVRYPSAQSRILWQTDTFVIVPSLGPIGSCHLLVLPRQHVTAMGLLSLREQHELSAILNGVRGRVEQAGRQVVIFEHGTMGDSAAGGCGISHAHTHLVAHDVDLVGVPDDLAWTPLAPIDDPAAITHLPKNAPYLFFVDTHGRAWYRRTAFSPSQYLRRMLADRIGWSGWDWREPSSDRNDLVSELPRLRALLGQLSVSTNG